MKPKLYMSLLTLVLLFSFSACTKATPEPTKESSSTTSSAFSSVEESTLSSNTEELPPTIPTREELAEYFLTEDAEILSEFDGLVYYQTQLSFQEVTTFCLAAAQNLAAEGEVTTSEDSPVTWTFAGTYGEKTNLVLIVVEQDGNVAVEVNY